MKGSDDGLVMGEFDFVILALSPRFIQFLLTNLYYLISLYSLQQVSDLDHFSKMKTHMNCVYQRFSEPLYTELYKRRHISPFPKHNSCFIAKSVHVIISGSSSLCCHWWNSGIEGNSGHGDYCQRDHSWTQKIETSCSGILIIFQVMADIIHFKWEKFRDHLWLN